MVNALTAEAKDRIGAAVATAERKTRAEIVVAVVDACDDYAAYPLLWALAGGFLVAGALSLLWPDMHVRANFLWSATTVLALALALHVPRLRGVLVPAHVKHLRAQRAARLHFAGHVAGRTAEATGVLIFAAVAERFVEIIPDAGIAKAVPETTWNAIVAATLPHLGGGLADGVIKLVEAAATTLAVPFPRRAEDHNQIPDAVVYTPQ